MEQAVKYKAIVIGTSAGGLTALTKILSKLPADYTIPVIVVQHRSRESNLLFEEVLQKSCSLKVQQAEEKEKIEAGKIYVAAPNYHLLIEQDETFSLSAGELIKFSRPSIDILFETAALAYKKKLISILLTGSNSDGAAGSLAVKKAGGLTIAQNPDEAQYSPMPQSAVDAGAINMVLDLADIAAFLLKVPTM